MNNITISWKPGITKLQNIKTLDMPELYQKGFFLLLGGSTYKSNLTYERIVSVYIGTSFDLPLGKALNSYMKDNGCVYRFLKNNYEMDLLFICGILQQPEADIISPDNIRKVKNIIVDQLEPACNAAPKEVTNSIAVAHQGMFDALVNKTGRV